MIGLRIAQSMHNMPTTIHKLYEEGGQERSVSAMRASLRYSIHACLRDESGNW